MSLGNWAQNFLKDAAGAFFGSDYLRDYTHASKTFRTNSYQNAPKLKFLFHTYFETNLQAFPNNFNYGLLVKDVRLPSFTFDTHQLNQYNRKRIVQTKIKYEPVEITFHDDNNDSVNYLWNNYYRYYYNDGTKPQNVLQAFRGSSLAGGEPSANGGATPGQQYNDRNIYNNSISGDDDWGFSGGETDSSTGKKVPFFKNITVFGFNQHNFTAYTFVNPIITNFNHDTYNYEDGNGVMQNKMTIDYETVVYNYGKMDGRKPGDIVTGFGDEATYDRNVSPISQPGANGTVLGQGGLVDGAGGALRALGEGDILGAVKTSGTIYNTLKNTNLKSLATAELNAMLKNAVQNTPNTRNTLFNFPKAGASPGPIGTAGFPTINARLSPPIISDLGTAGEQYNGADKSGGGGPGSPAENYYAALEASADGTVFEPRDFSPDLGLPDVDLDDPTTTDYKIKKGDNLTKIAKANNTTVQALMEANPNIKNPNLIRAGETLKIPTSSPAADPTVNNTNKDAFNPQTLPSNANPARDQQIAASVAKAEQDLATPDLSDPVFPDDLYSGEDPFG